MKIVLRIIVVSVCVVMGTFALFHVIFSDIVTKRYASLVDARADQLFERGWLPDILPPSTHNIRTSNNLDLNVSTGEFSFASRDYNALATRLTPYKPMPNPFEDFAGEVARKLRNGYQAGSYTEERVAWVFFCKPQANYCEYTMWSR